MNIGQILSVIKSLACSQGFYSRLYAELENIRNTAPELWKEITAELEGQNFKDSVDMVLYFES